ncbi:MAG: HAD-IA family hydrolase, partial [Antricoccus sp.]
PDRQIYRLAVERLGLAAGDCVFIDDMAGNVTAAVACGLVGIHHLSARETIDQLEAIFALTVINDADWHDES